MTSDEFERFVMRPENADKVFEFIGGEIVEVEVNVFASAIAIGVGAHIYSFVRNSSLKGHITGEAGGYKVFGERYLPSVAYISAAKQPALDREGYNSNPPDLAVEVEFPSTHQSLKDLRIKIANYLAAGTVVWAVYPETRTIEVYTPGQPVRILTEADTLDGGDVLPGFTLAVRDVFVGL